MMPELMREHIHPALAAPAGDHLIDPVGGQRPAVVYPEPQLRPPRLRVPGPDPEVAVEAAGSVIADPDDPGLAALAPDGDLTVPQVHVTAPWVFGVVADPGQFRHSDAGRLEHCDNGGVAALRGRAALAGLL